MLKCNFNRRNICGSKATKVYSAWEENHGTYGVRETQASFEDKCSGRYLEEEESDPINGKERNQASEAGLEEKWISG